ncbi:MAG: type II secretion system F family protein [Planctomycetaceae bacterium]|nr:type II secretion system F family protein [Planctomycetales bacterium]MCB9874707.1 type II secretion system F family protein [Planctomycetaceae bacterium]MCB9938373.1 type II secretion system F family protein [Planctomycetaceae bacterium]
MNFDYTGRDPLGQTHDGAIDAATRDEAIQTLNRDGLQVIKISEGDDGLNLFPRRLTRSDIIYTTTQLAIMVDTGINLATALQGLLEQEDNPTLHKLLTALKKDVEAGECFSAAVARHPRYFDKTFVALIRASEQTGTLGEMLDHIADYMRKDLESRSKVRSALAYPVVMMVLAMSVTTFLLTFVMPKFTPLFARKGIKLPSTTVFLMHLSEAMTEYWYAWLAGAVVLVVGFLYGRRTDVGRMALDYLRLNMPILGPMFRKVCISRSIRSLGAMVQSGVSVLEALKLSAEVSGNYYYEKAWKDALEEVTNGSRISEALAGNDLFPRTLIQMIGSGEDTGRLDYVLKKVSGYYDGEVETALKTATSMLEPMMITVMGVVVGGIGMSVMLPIFTLSRSH